MSRYAGVAAALVLAFVWISAAPALASTGEETRTYLISFTGRVAVPPNPCTQSVPDTVEISDGSKLQVTTHVKYSHSYVYQTTSWTSTIVVEAAGIRGVGQIPGLGGAYVGMGKRAFTSPTDLPNYATRSVCAELTLANIAGLLLSCGSPLPVKLDMYFQHRTLTRVTVTTVDTCQGRLDMEPSDEEESNSSD